jgi:hypothetical protein
VAELGNSHSLLSTPYSALLRTRLLVAGPVMIRVDDLLELQVVSLACLPLRITLSVTSQIGAAGWLHAPKIEEGGERSIRSGVLVARFHQIRFYSILRTRQVWSLASGSRKCPTPGPNSSANECPCPCPTAQLLFDM